MIISDRMGPYSGQIAIARRVLIEEISYGEKLEDFLKTDDLREIWEDPTKEINHTLKEFLRN